MDVKYKWKAKEYCKRYYEKNKAKVLARQREYRKNNRKFYKEYMDDYREAHKDELREKRVKRDLEKGYVNIHNITAKKIRELWIRPCVCPLCNNEKRIYTHHPNYEKWYEVVFCCQSCHQKMHSWTIKCPTSINLLDFNK